METQDPFARRLLAQYLSRRAADIESVRRALDEGDWEHVRVTGHNMYGSGEAYGLKAVSEYGKQLEQAALDVNQPAASDAIAALETFLRDIKIS
ncbi:MAG: Hpt domain-containing protein [Pseudomonadota bacterium]